MCGDSVGVVGGDDVRVNRPKRWRNRGDSAVTDIPQAPLPSQRFVQHHYHHNHTATIRTIGRTLTNQPEPVKEE